MAINERVINGSDPGAVPGASTNTLKIVKVFRALGGEIGSTNA
jgi:hypothetical protein